MQKLVLLLGCVLLTACAGQFTRSPTENMSRIHPGMTQADVEKHLGAPVESEEQGELTALHYCKTGYFKDDYVIVVLNKGKVAAVKNYSVNFRQSSPSPDCADNILPFNFSSVGSLPSH